MTDPIYHKCNSSPRTSQTQRNQTQRLHKRHCRRLRDPVRLVARGPQVRATLDFLFFSRWRVLRRDTSEPRRSIGETQGVHDFVSCRCEMTEMMLKAA